MSRSVKRVLFVIVGILVLGGVMFEGATRFRVEARYRSALQDKRQLEAKMVKLRTERDRLFEVLKSEQRRADAVAQQLSAKDEQLKQVMARLAHEDLIVKDLQQRLAATQGHADKLEQELVLALSAVDAPAKDSAKTVRLDKVIVAPAGTAATKQVGSVVSIHPEWKFVVINFGWDTVNVGDVVSIYRQDQLLGKARVERVQETAAAASLLPEWNGAHIQVADVVRAL